MPYIAGTATAPPPEPVKNVKKNKLRGRPFGTGLAQSSVFERGTSCPRVLLVSDSPEPSGVGQHMLTLATALRNDVRPTLVFAESPGGSALARASRDAGLYACQADAADMAGGGPQFQALLDRHAPDLVHIHAGIGWEGHALAAAARRWGAKAVVRTEHLPYTLRPLRNPALEADYARGVEPVDRIICVCHAAKQTFRMSGVDAGRFVVVHNGISPSRPRRTRAQVRAELGLASRVLILTVARFCEQKRHDILLDALPRLLERHPRAHLLWAGSGPLEARLRAQARALGVTDHVSFLGARKDVPELMAACDAFCLPSYFEGHPIVVLEAMAAGLPVIAARSLGITETVCDGETGLLFPYAHAPLLAHALGKIVADPGLAACLGEAGRRLVAAEFSAARMADDTLAVYLEVLGAATDFDQGEANGESTSWPHRRWLHRDTPSQGPAKPAGC